MVIEGASSSVMTVCDMFDNLVDVLKNNDTDELI